MRVVLLSGIVLGTVVLVGFFIFSSSNPVPAPTPQMQETVDIKASFGIFTNGTFRIFTASMYHNLSDDVYIEASSPNIVIVKKAGATWGDFFATLPMNVTRDCLTTGTGQTFCSSNAQTLKFYINGQRDTNALEKRINAGDQLLVSYGNENSGDIEKQLKQIPIL